MTISNATEIIEAPHTAAGESALARPLAAAQGLYYLSTGIWPLVHMRSFEAVTGPKIERWLVKTVGVLATAIGFTLLGRARRGGSFADARTLAVTSAIGFAAVDFWYASARRRISPIYLLDAAAEVALAGLWLTAARAPAR
jgi:hypothetical protein